MLLPRHPSRRIFCFTAAAAFASLRTPPSAQSQSRSQTRSQTHPDVAAIDHDRILAAASRALDQPVAPLTTLPAKRSPGSPQDFYSEPEDFFADPASPTAVWVRRPGGHNPDAFTSHRDAVYTLGITVAALTAAFLITREERYAAHAADHLRAWFITPETRLTPGLRFAQRIPSTPAGRPEGVMESLPLAEVARSLSWLAQSASIPAAELTVSRAWFAEYSKWLNESRMAGLARDQKDHHASSWLFQAAAYADANVVGLTSDDTALNALRRRFQTVTLRAQLNAYGVFPHEVSTEAPYRNSLFNLDLLALACELMTTRFENPWEYELQDGPGMRTAIAHHFPFLLDPATWPYPADASHFKELPSRRISLLLSGRAYNRPEYVALWQNLSPLPPTSAPELLRTFPVSQPLLWVSRPRLPILPQP